MFCPKCGKEIEDSAKFCDGCGESLQSPTIEIKNENVNAVINDGKKIIKGFFSKNPASAISTAQSSQSKIGLVLLLINIVLFGLVSCFNITQVINHIIDSAISTATSSANSLLGGLFGDLLTETAIPNINIPILFNLFLPFALVALVITGLIFAGIYIIFKLEKKPFKKFDVISNYIGVSCLPLITALIINFVFGFFLPQVTLYVFIIGLLVSLVFIYDSLRSIFDKEQAPIIEISVLLLIILIAFAIVFKIAINQLDSALQDFIIKSAANGVEDIFGGIFG